MNKGSFLRYISIGMPYVCGHLIGVTVVILVLLDGYDPFATQGSWKDSFADSLFYDKYQFDYPYPYGYGAPHPSLVFTIVVLTLLPALHLTTLRGLGALARWSRERSLSLQHRIQRRRIYAVVFRMYPEQKISHMLFIFFVACVATWCVLLLDQAVYEIREEMFWHNWNRFGGYYPTPKMGYLTWTDLVSIGGAWFVIGWFQIIRPARKRIARSHYINKRWCRNCGYPIAQENQNCPECGARGPAR